jgi:hypothetical protein
MDKIRVAVCLSGFMRTYDEGVDDWVNNIIRPLNADLFISSWTVMGWRIKHGIPPMMADGADVGSLEVDWSVVLKRYGTIKGLIVDEYEKFEPRFKKRAKRVYDARTEFGLRKDDQPKANLSMYYKIWSANKLKQDAEKAEGMKYDIVIRSRPDTFVKALSPACLKISDALRTQPHGTNLKEASDFIFVSSSKTIDWMCSIHKKYDKMFKNAVEAKCVGDMNSVLQPHLLYMRIINEGKFKIQHINMGVEVIQ